MILVVTVKNTSPPRLWGNSLRKDTLCMSHGRLAGGLASRPRGQNGSGSLSIAKDLRSSRGCSHRLSFQNYKKKLQENTPAALLAGVRWASICFSPFSGSERRGRGGSPQTTLARPQQRKGYRSPAARTSAGPFTRPRKIGPVALAVPRRPSPT